MSQQRQTIHSIHNKKFWTEFFYLYESLPALWDMKNPLYKNRQVKCDAYDMMVDKLREIAPNADREDVLRKINIFRTNFRRECSRINMSIQEGRQYQSTLWYFDLLGFLQTADTRRDRKRKLDDDCEKTILRKRRPTNMIQKSSDQYVIALKKDQLIEYQPHSTHDFKYDLEEEPEFDYVPDELGHALVDGKSRSNSETQPNSLTLNNYQDIEEDDYEDDHSRQQCNHQDELQNYSLQRNFQTNNQKIKLIADNVSQIGGEINTNETPIQVHDGSEEQQIFQEYSTDNETDTMHAAQWSIKTTNAQNSATIQFQKPGLAGCSNVTTNTINFNENCSTKYVRNVKTMTSGSSHSSCCNKLSESSEILAKSWAVQYDELSQDQKMLARKAISDILFEGCMGHLAIGSNGRVAIDGADYTNFRTTKGKSNKEVESSEIYEQSAVAASSTSSTSGMGAGADATLTASAATSPKAHSNHEWLKL